MSKQTKTRHREQYGVTRGKEGCEVVKAKGGQTDGASG